MSAADKEVKGIMVPGRNHRQSVPAFRHPVHGLDGVFGFRHPGARTVEIPRGVTEASLRPTHHDGEGSLERQQGTQHFTPHAHQRSRWKGATVAGQEAAQDDRFPARPDEAIECAGLRLGLGDLVDEFDATQDEVENAVVDGVNLPAQAGEGVFGRCQRDAPAAVLGQACCLGDIRTKGKTRHACLERSPRRIKQSVSEKTG